MRYLTYDEVVYLHQRLIAQSGGAPGLRDAGALQSALAQPGMAAKGKERYATVIAKAAALGFSLIQNRPFVDGNDRAAHAAMETFLQLNAYEIEATVDEQERTIVQVAAGIMKREDFALWLSAHATTKGSDD